MRANLLFPAILGLFALAQSQSMPPCAADCLGRFLPQSPCNSTDFVCICSDTSLMGDVQTCTLASCTVKESLSAKNATATLCGEPVRDNTAVTPIVTGVAGVVAIVCVILRLGDRFPSWERIQWADLCVVLSLLFAIPMGVLEFFMSSDGFGKDIWTIPFDKVTRIVKFTWLTEIFYMVVLGLTKMAILLLYLRVFPTQNFRKVVVASLVVCAAYIPAFALAISFHCSPISYGWTSWSGETEGHCFNLNAFAWAHAIINIIFDLWVLLLPMPQLLQLHLGRRKKVHLLLMFGVGIFITVVSIVRLSSLVRFANTTNATYDNVPTAYWSVLEAFVSIICTCLPAIRALLRRIFPSCFGSSSDPESNDRPYYVSRSTELKNTVGHTANANPSSEFSDVIELVQPGDSKGQPYQAGWSSAR